VSHEDRVKRAWGITGRIAIIGILIIVAILAVQSRVSVVESCRDRNGATVDAAERAKVLRVFLDTAADARDAAYQRSGFVEDRRAATEYRQLIRRTKVPRPIECPTFWHN
jgi:hypothetical protein